MGIFCFASRPANGRSTAVGPPGWLEMATVFRPSSPLLVVILIWPRRLRMLFSETTPPDRSVVDSAQPSNPNLLDCLD